MARMKECDRVLAVREKSQAIGEFLEWLQGEKNLVLSQYHRHSEECGPKGNRECGCSEEELMPVHIGIEKLLADFFEIDFTRMERQKVNILRQIRRDHEEEFIVSYGYGAR